MSSLLLDSTFISKRQHLDITLKPVNAQIPEGTLQRQNEPPEPCLILKDSDI
jgi:hypothetical protein